MSFFQIFSRNGQNEGRVNRRNNHNHSALSTVDSILSMEEEENDVEQPNNTVESSRNEDARSNRGDDTAFTLVSPTHESSNNENQTPLSLRDTNVSDENDQANDSTSDLPQYEQQSSISEREQILNYINEHSANNASSKISTPLVIAVCVCLFRLFLEGLANGDVRMLAAVLLSIWFLRWVQLQNIDADRDEEEIAAVLEEVMARGDDGGTGYTSNVELLGFRGQLALAMLESRRALHENGGYGRPDDAQNLTGVSEETKAGWEKLTLRSSSVQEKIKDNDDMVCCICLGEYEADESLCELPCGHIFHEKCISNWCENHQTCPLCNTNLEEVHQKLNKSKDSSCVQASDDSIV